MKPMSGIKYNPEVNLGHLLQFGGMLVTIICVVGTGVYLWANTQGDIRLMRRDVDYIMKAQESQAKTMDSIVATQSSLTQNLTILTTIMNERKNHNGN